MQTTPISGLVPAYSATTPVSPRNTGTILDAWRAGKSPHTLRSYEHDLRAFARFYAAGLGETLTVETALERLFREDSASAHMWVLNFRA